MELEGKNKNNFQQYLTREKLAVAGVQFGHPVAKQNPKMKPYIYGVRKSNKYHGNKMHFINLLMTIKGVEKAINFLEKLKQENGILLLVGIKRQTRGIIKSLAEELKLPYITERWIGGCLTNFNTIKSRIGELWLLEKDVRIGETQFLSKAELMLFEKKKAKLEKKFGGIKTLQRVPNAIFVINDAIHSTAIKEAAKLNIPIIGICDTNSDPDLITYPIPANDDAIKSIHVIALALLSVFEPSLLTRIDEVLTKKFETEGETTPTDETVNKTTEKKEESIN